MRVDRQAQSPWRSVERLTRGVLTLPSEAGVLADAGIASAGAMIVDTAVRGIIVEQHRLNIRRRRFLT